MRPQPGASRTHWELQPAVYYSRTCMHMQGVRSLWHPSAVRNCAGKACVHKEPGVSLLWWNFRIVFCSWRIVDLIRWMAVPSSCRRHSTVFYCCTSAVFSTPRRSLEGWLKSQKLFYNVGLPPLFWKKEKCPFCQHTQSWNLIEVWQMA